MFKVVYTDRVCHSEKSGINFENSNSCVKGHIVGLTVVPSGLVGSVGGVSSRPGVLAASLSTSSSPAAPSSEHTRLACYTL